MKPARFRPGHILWPEWNHRGLAAGLPRTKVRKRLDGTVAVEFHLD
jgi:hypothetical protein